MAAYHTPARPRLRSSSAKSGTGHFLASTPTAIANIPLTIAAIVILVMLLGRNQAAAAQILGSPAIAIIMLLFIVSNCIRAG